MADKDDKSSFLGGFFSTETEIERFGKEYGYGSAEAYDDDSQNSDNSQTADSGSSSSSSGSNVSGGGCLFALLGAVGMLVSLVPLVIVGDSEVGVPLFFDMFCTSSHRCYCPIKW